jgi:glycosyltransferase involved in cell wall biosynthesis
MVVLHDANVLLVTALSPEDPRQGRDLRLWSLLGGGRARVICCERKTKGTHGMTLSDPLPWAEIAAVSDEPSGRHRTTSRFERLLDAVKDTLGTGTPVLVSGRPCDLAYHLALRFPQRIVTDLCDCAALYYWRRSKALRHRDPLRALANVLLAVRSRSREVAIARHAGLAILSSPVDAAWLQRRAPGAPIRVVGNGTDWLRHVPPAADECQRVRLVIHGVFEWYPNRAAVEYLARAVWPRIRTEAPDAEFHVVGPGLPADLSRLCQRQGMVVRGYVDDIFGVIATSGLYVSPMIAGGGVKNKLMEAMAAGVPVVTNTMGAEALPPEAREVVAIHDEPQAFADCVRDIIANPARWSELRRKSRSAAERCFDWSRVRAEFAHLLAEVAASYRGQAA